MLRDELARYAVIDLKPFTAQAKQQLSAAVAEFAKQDPSVRVDAGITDLRLVGIAFDTMALRIIAEADGKLNIAVSSLAL